MAVDPDVEQPFTLVSGRVPDDILAIVPDRGGWVNFVPEVDPGHEVAPRSLFATIFSNRGNPVPLATWSAPDDEGARPTLGIEHGWGPGALARLEEAGSPLPEGWLKLTDHARRGLVVTAPVDVDRAEAIRWLLEAATALSTVPLTGSWLARAFLPR